MTSHMLRVRTTVQLIQEEIARRWSSAPTAPPLPPVKWIVSDTSPEVLNDVARELHALSSTADAPAWADHVWRLVGSAVARLERLQPPFTASTGPVVMSRDRGCFIVLLEPSQRDELVGSLTANTGQVVTDSPEGFLSPDKVMRATARNPALYVPEAPDVQRVPHGVLEAVAAGFAVVLRKRQRSDHLLRLWFEWLASIRWTQGRLEHDQRFLGLLPARPASPHYVDLHLAPTEIATRMATLAALTVSDLDAGWAQSRNRAVLDRIQLDGPVFLRGVRQQIVEPSDGGPEALAALASYLAGHELDDGRPIDFQTRLHYPRVLEKWPPEAVADLFIRPEPSANALLDFRLAEGCIRSFAPGGLPIVHASRLEFEWQNVPTSNPALDNSMVAVKVVGFPTQTGTRIGEAQLGAERPQIRGHLDANTVTPGPLHLFARAECGGKPYGELEMLVLVPAPNRSTAVALCAIDQAGRRIWPNPTTPKHLPIGRSTVALEAWFIGDDGKLVSNSSAPVLRGTDGDSIQLLSSAADTVGTFRTPFAIGDWPWTDLVEGLDVDIEFDATAHMATTMGGRFTLVSEIESLDSSDHADSPTLADLVLLDNEGRGAIGSKGELTNVRLGRTTADAFPCTATIRSRDGVESAITFQLARRPASDDRERVVLDRALLGDWLPMRVTEEPWLIPNPALLEHPQVSSAIDRFITAQRTVAAAISTRVETAGSLEGLSLVIPWLDARLVDAYVDTWIDALDTLVAIRKNGSPGGSRSALELLHGLALANAVISEHGEALMLGPLHPVNLQWLHRHGSLVRRLQSAQFDPIEMAALRDLDLTGMPQFVSLVHPESVSIIRYEQLDSDASGWSLYGQWKHDWLDENKQSKHDPAFDRWLELYGGRTERDVSLVPRVVARAIADYHYAHPLRRDLVIRWPEVIAGDETWLGRSGRLGLAHSKTAPGSVQRANYGNLRIEIQSPTPLVPTPWRPASPAAHLDEDFMTITRGTAAGGHCDIAFVGDRPYASREPEVTRLAAELLADSLVLTTARHFDAHAGPGDAILMTESHGIVEPTGGDRLAAGLLRIQRIDAIDNFDLPYNPDRFRVKRVVLNASNPYFTELDTALSSARWVFLAGGHIDIEYFDHLARKSGMLTHVVQYRPNLPWWRGDAEGRDLMHGLVAVTTRTEDLHGSLVRHFDQEYGTLEGAAPIHDQMATAVLEWLNAYAPGEMARLGYSRGQRQAAVGMAVTAALFEPRITRKSIRILAPIDDYWETLAGHSAGTHADYLDLILELVDDGLLIRYQVIEVKNRPSASPAELITYLRSQLPGTITSLVAGALDQTEPGVKDESEHRRHRRAANLFAMLDHLLRRELARNAETSGLSDTEAVDLYVAIRNQVAGCHYRFELQTFGTAPLAGTLVALHAGNGTKWENLKFDGLPADCRGRVVGIPSAAITSILLGDSAIAAYWRRAIFEDADHGVTAPKQAVDDFEAVAPTGENVEAAVAGHSPAPAPLSGSDPLAADDDNTVVVRAEPEAADAGIASPPKPEDPNHQDGILAADLPVEVVVRLGINPYGSEVSYRPSVRANPHLLLVGISGMGKTTATLNILARMHQAGVIPFAVDFHGDLAERLPQVLGGEKVLVLDPAEGLALNPMSLTSRDRERRNGWKEHCYTLADVWCSVFPDFGELQRDAIVRSMQQAYERAGFASAEAPDEFPPFESFFEILGEGQDQRSQSIIARLRPFFDLETFTTEGSVVPFDTIAEQPTILRLSSISDEWRQTAIAGFFLQRLYREMFTRGEASYLRQVILLDEAHRASKLELLSRFMKEARKFGIALILASQRVDDFRQDVFDTTGSLLMMRVGDRDARRLKQILGGTNTQTILQSLQPYTALFRSSDYQPYEDVTLDGPGWESV